MKEIKGHHPLSTMVSTLSPFFQSWYGIRVQFLICTDRTSLQNLRATVLLPRTLTRCKFGAEIAQESSRRQPAKLRSHSSGAMISNVLRGKTETFKSFREYALIKINVSNDEQASLLIFSKSGHSRWTWCK